MSRALKHLHVYEKSATTSEDWRKQIYRCKDKVCHHYQTAQFIEGKEVSCFKCGNPTVIMKPQLWQKNRYLVCIMCSRSPKKVLVEASRKAADEIMGEMFSESDPILNEIRKEKL